MDTTQNLHRILRMLIEHPTPSGTEYRITSLLRQQFGEACDEILTDGVGNHILVRRAACPDAPTLLVDCHLDQIGMMVTSLEEGGFLRVRAVGGLDSRILPSAEVVVLGREDIPAVIASTPPHLATAETAKVLPAVRDLLLDTGYEKETLATLVAPGDFAVFRPEWTELENGRLAAPGLDDRACVASALCALLETPRQEQQVHLCILLSACEETGDYKGARTAALRMEPDAALVLDVNFAKGPGIPDKESIALGKGPSVSLSALTSRRLTRRVRAVADEQGIPCQVVVEATNLGTNGNAVCVTGGGIPQVNLSLPLSSMHTMVECVSTADLAALQRLLCALFTDAEFAREVRA